MSGDEAAIRQVVGAWLAASRAGDVSAMLDLMTDDVIFMTPGQEPFGKETYAAISKDMKDVQIEVTGDIKEIQVLGDWAFLRNHIEMTVDLPENGGSICRSGYTLTILRKEAGNRWRVARDANLVTRKN